MPVWCGEILRGWPCRANHTLSLFGLQEVGWRALYGMDVFPESDLAHLDPGPSKIYHFRGA